MDQIGKRFLMKIKAMRLTSKVCLALLMLLLGSIHSFAQSKKMSSSKMAQPSYELSDAREILESDPQKAVLILNSIINSKRQNTETRSEAYELLGDINYNSSLFPQSIDRYQKAISTLGKRAASSKRTELSYKIGRSFLDVSPSDAIPYFENCMRYDAKGTLFNRCLEGEADALRLTQALDQALSNYRKLEATYKLSKQDDLSRIQAKIADVLAQQENIQGALLSYGQSQSNYSNSDKSNDKAMQNATNNIIKNQENIQDEIALRSSNVTAYEDTRELVAEERIQLAEAYVKSGNTSKALLELNELKPVLSTLPESTKANYYKKNSEIYTIQGNYKSAVENFQAYENSRNKVLDQRETELDNRLKINDLQSFVDLEVKDSENEQDRSRFTESLSKRKTWIIYLLIALLIGALVAAFLIQRNVQAKKAANQLLELRSLRSEMNPHFIFNALGSVNEFIATKDTRAANRFLSDFSTLMRSAMEMNKKDLIPLQEELKFSELYLKLEHARWEDKFSYEINIDYDSIDSDLLIPPLLIQPYIENAIWHGLRYKEGHGMLHFELIDQDGQLTIRIQDNGIGRKNSEISKTSNQKQYASTGMKNTKKRAALINTLYEKQLRINISDASESGTDTGTIVEIKLS